MRDRLDVTTEPWQRVSPRYVVAVLVEALVSGVALAAVCAALALLAGWWWAWFVLAVVAVGTVVRLVIAPRQARAIGYRLRDDDLLFRRGIMVQRLVAVPYGRMQLIDVTRGPVRRMLGLADLKFVTAAAATGVEIPGLPEDEAERLRDRLVALAESRRAGL